MPKIKKGNIVNETTLSYISFKRSKWVLVCFASAALGLNASIIELVIKTVGRVSG